MQVVSELNGLLFDKNVSRYEVLVMCVACCAHAQAAAAGTRRHAPPRRTLYPYHHHITYFLLYTLTPTNRHVHTTVGLRP